MLKFWILALLTMRIVIKHKAIVFKKLEVGVPAVAEENLIPWFVPPAGHKAVHLILCIVVTIANLMFLLLLGSQTRPITV